MLLTASLVLLAALPSFADHEEPVEEIVITGRHSDSDAEFEVDPARANPSRPDSAALLDLIPGADVVPNGPITGQVQYRGLWGPRVDVKIADVSVDPAGPNTMDPPLSYAPSPIVQSLQLSRGIAPVSAGAETLGGQVRAVLKGIDFADEGERDVAFDAEIGGRSADASFMSGGNFSFATDRHKFEMLGSYELGDDRRSPEGRVRNTEYERSTYGLGYGFKPSERSDLGAQWQHTNIDDTGTPALPMDIRFFDTEMVQGEINGTIGEVDLHARGFYTGIKHRMDNYTLRRAPAAAMQRFVKARGKSAGWDFNSDYAVGIGSMKVGTEGFLVRHDMRVGSPVNPAFFVNNFNDSTRNRYGAFAEWSASPLDHVGVDLGFRYTRVNMDSGVVDSLPSQLLAGPMALRNAFNAAKRDKSDNHYDFTIRGSYTPIEGLRIEAGVARKTRSPYYIERYAWLPLEVTGGLADGRNYVGDIDLDEEVSYEGEIGIAWRWRWLYIAPRAFYRHVDDYIQGTPSRNPIVIAVSTANGDPMPLQFSNVEAELYGADAEFGIELPWDLQIDGSIAYVRGKRKDRRDNLYRIAPLNGRTTLTYKRDSWSISLEGVYAGKQDKVSSTNGEATSKSWAVMNIFGSWEFAHGFLLSLGVDNVTDNLYRPHLAGRNRVVNSAVALGQRLPGTGVNAWGRLGYRF